MASCALRPENQSSNHVSNNITPMFESHFVPSLVDETIAEMLNIPLVP